MMTAILCILAITAAAATLNSPVAVSTDESGGVDFNPRPGRNASGDQMPIGNATGAGGQQGTMGGSPIRLSVCVRPLTSTLGMLAYFGGTALIFYLLYRRLSAGIAMMAGYAFSPIIVMAYFLLTACPTAGGKNIGSSGNATSLVEQAANSQVVSSPQISPVIPGIIFAVVLIGSVALFYSASGSQQPEELREPAEEAPDVTDLGRAAGAAADRLEARDADVDNEVYRAWKEMTDLLEMDSPETSTPGEFADEAVAVGMSEAHVGDLTKLFEEVRYGGAAPDEQREGEAIEVLRAIEEAYAAPATGSERVGDDAT